MKAGVGTASIDIAKGVIVGALVGVNAWGDVVDPQTGQVVAGLRAGMGRGRRVGKKESFADTLRMMKTMERQPRPGLAGRANTVIGVVATNAKLTKAQATKVAQMAQDGLARTIRPAHTMWDGDVIFALSTGTEKADTSTVGAFAAEVVAEAILRAVKMTSPAGGLPGLFQEPSRKTKRG
jgi:L-aminopeptidase/D-esterase-like protein